MAAGYLPLGLTPVQAVKQGSELSNFKFHCINKGKFSDGGMFSDAGFRGESGLKPILNPDRSPSEM